MTGQNVSEVSNAVVMKHVDVAIVWDVTAAMYKKTQLETIPMSAEEAVVSAVPVAMITYSRQPANAQKFMDFLASPEGQAIFAKHGFGAPPKEAAPAVKTG